MRAAAGLVVVLVAALSCGPARAADPAHADDAADPNAAVDLAESIVREDPDRALALWLEAADRLRASGDHAAETRTRMRLTRFLTRRMRLDEAREQIGPLREAAVRSGDRALAVESRLRESDYWFLSGDYGRSWLTCREVESDPAFETLPVMLRLAFLNQLQRDTDRLGHTGQAFRYGLRALALVDDNDLHDRYRDDVLQGIAQTAWRMFREDEMDREEALRWANEAVEAARRDGQVFMLIPALRAASELEGGERRMELLEELYRLGLEHDCAAFSAYSRGTQARHIIETDLAAKAGGAGPGGGPVRPDPEVVDRAFAMLDEALRIAEEEGDERVRLDAIETIARLRRATGPHERAVADSLAAIEAFEQNRLRLTAGELRAGWLAHRAYVYTSLVGYLLRGDGRAAGATGTGVTGRAPEDLSIAFDVIERLRARELLDHLALAAGEEVSDEARRIAGERGAVHAGIARVQVLAARAAQEETASAEAERRRLLDELERLELGDRALEAELRSAHAPQEFASVDDVRGALAADEALLSFTMASEGMGGAWLIAVTRDVARAYRLPPRSEITTALRFWLGLIRARDPLEARAAARVHEQVMTRALDDLGDHVTRLVVVPDGVLHRAPFDALRAGSKAEPLAWTHAVSVVPSATLWLAGRRGRAEAGAAGGARPIEVSPLVLADPARGGFEEGADAGGGGEDAPRAMAASLPVSIAGLGPLPATRDEARAVVDAFGGAGLLLAGERASEAFVKRAPLARHGLVHFAAHAVVDDEHPERSAIVLAPGGEEEDGLLQPREIVGLPLDGGLVTLAACRSASGRIVGGEGPLSLARSFFRAGARTVVGSLWPLRDDEARFVFGAFYARLADGLPVAEALAAARRDAMADGLPAAAWAGIVVFGDGDLVVRPGGPGANGGAGGGTAVTAALLLLVVAGAVLVTGFRS